MLSNLAPTNDAPLKSAFSIFEPLKSTPERFAFLKLTFCKILFLN